MVDRLPKSYLAGWITSIILAFGPLFIDSHRDLYIIYLPGILSIITLVIIDQWNSAEQRSKLTSQMMTEYNDMREEISSEYRKLREEIFSECQRAITGAQVVSTFSLLDAHHYVAANSVRARRIFNTRLGDSGSELKDQGYMQARGLQDDGFIAAIQKGNEYHLVFDVTHEASVKEFLQRVKNPGAGIVRTSPVDARGTPLLQFIVLEYQEFKECLVGYGLGGDITATPDIYLIRSGPLCDYLRRVHESYIRMLSPKVH